MSKALYDFVVSIVDNKDITEIYGVYVGIISPGNRKEAHKIFKLVRSRNFLDLINFLNISMSEAEDLKSNVLEILATDNISRGFLAYSSILGFVNRKLERDDRIANSSIAYSTANNVRTSERVESLGIKGFNSIVSNFRNFSGFAKDSASYSIVFTATLDDLGTFYFKIFPIGGVMKDNGKMGTYGTTGLEFEVKAYSEVFKLAKYNITPNILCKAITGNFKNLKDEFINNTGLPLEFRRVILGELKKINIQLDVAELEYTEDRELGTYSTQIWQDTGVLITNPGGPTLRENILDVSALERKQIMFQILYTLYVFEKLEISHGDLHSGNVFVVDVEPTQMCFMVEGMEFSFTTTKLVKIYDFDFGNISKDTNIKLNTKSKFRINRILNENRWPGKYMNKQYGLSEYFNKHLDLCILLFSGLRFTQSRVEEMILFGTVDSALDSFIRDGHPGFNRTREISKVSIHDSLSSVLSNKKNYIEASRVFNIKISGPGNIKRLNIGKEVLNMPWLEYYNHVIIPSRGHLLKQLVERGDNNQLWIPDNVIIPKVDMLGHAYFRELRGSVPTNVRNAPLYTLDSKLL
jgi:hypothetical protein